MVDGIIHERRRKTEVGRPNMEVGDRSINFGLIKN
jgi:hypothetical protein